MTRLKVKISYPDDEVVPSAANLNHSPNLKPEVNQPTSCGEPESAEPVLSQVQAQVLLSLAAGTQNAKIAGELGLDEAAVKDHIKSILRAVMGRTS
jgi:DNA-binding NarL/FixJ family response regulator